ncbi:MAG: hypothetical protein R3F20_16745 [Planctomycetota bacterium]
MIRLSTLALVLAVLASGVSAQIVQIHLKDEKAEKRYAKYLVEVSGSKVLLGEPITGFKIEGNQLTLLGVKVIELYVLDGDRPEKVPYKFKDGEKSPVSKRSVVSVARDDIDLKRLPNFFNDRQTLMGIASEYELNLERIAEIEAKRDASEKASKEWFDLQRRVLEARRRVATWLREHGCDKAAARMDKDGAKEEKRLEEDGVEARRATALASVRKAELPPELVRANQEITGGKLTFHAMESKHLVVWYPTTIEDGAMRIAIETCERVIEGFRREFVDGFVNDGDPDWIEDEQFSCYLFLPDDTTLRDRFWTDFLGQRWGRNKEQSLTVAVNGARSVLGHSFGEMCKIRDPLDLEGMMVYLLAGHLAHMHFGGGGRSRSAMPWLVQGLQYYLCFEFLGRNIMTSFQWKEREYDIDPGREGVKTVQLGQRAAFNAVAVKLGVPFSDLAVKDIYEMDDPDLAKCWSFYDFLARTEPDRINRFLRAGCTHWNRGSGGTRNKGEVLNSWREDMREIFGVPEGTDPLRYLDEKWKAYAQGGQRKERGVRK